MGPKRRAGAVTEDLQQGAVFMTGQGRGGAAKVVCGGCRQVWRHVWMMVWMMCGGCWRGMQAG